MAGKLAINGGTPVRTRPFAPRETMGEAEKRAVNEVMDRGQLSMFFGSPGPQFNGGRTVRAFEDAWCERFGYRHAISVNSWTTGLAACVGAVGLGPGDEMICSPYTMSASASVAIQYGAVPVFADVDPVSFCLDPASVESRITPRTKAIMAVHIFGGTADMAGLRAVADRHNLRLIEDAAQAPGATYGGSSIGAQRDIGGFSLNYHKHIHTGEGGVIVTNDDDLALRARLIRNHGENIVEGFGVEDLTNMVGSNYRLTELQAAIGIVQLSKLDAIVERRRQLAARLIERTSPLAPLTPPATDPNGSHVYYVFAWRYDENVLGVPRAAFAAAVRAELPEPATSDDLAMGEAYVKPLYALPMYQRRIGLGSSGFPFNYHPDADLDYRWGICPTVERLWERETLLTALVRDPLEEADIDDLANAIEKVVENASELRPLAAA